MSNEKIARILDQHSIPHYIENGRIYADCMIAGTQVFEEVEDMTGCSKNELYDWLGY